MSDEMGFSDGLSSHTTRLRTMNTHAHPHTYTVHFTHTHSLTQAHTHTHAHTACKLPKTHARTPTHAPTHPLTHPHTHTHTDTHARTHARTHTHTRQVIPGARKLHKLCMLSRLVVMPPPHLEDLDQGSLSCECAYSSIHAVILDVPDVSRASNV